MKHRQKSVFSSLQQNFETNIRVSDIKHSLHDKSHDFFSHKNFSTRAIKLFKRGQHIYMSMKRVSLFFSFRFI